MKGISRSFVFIFVILVLLWSSCDAGRRRRRSAGLVGGGFDARERREAGVTCEPEATNPDNGKVDCSNGNQHKSECDYTCNDGYKLSDSELRKRRCDWMEWSSEEPSCIKI